MTQRARAQETPAAESVATVSRTYRAAIRCGEDFLTVEETVVLPATASDQEIEQAVGLGMRIYAAQRAAVEAQIAGIRANAPAAPFAAATGKQIEYLATLAYDAGFESIAAAIIAAGFEQETLSKTQASDMIARLQAGTLTPTTAPSIGATEAPADKAEETEEDLFPVEPEPTPSPINPSSGSQHRAIRALAQNKSLNLQAVLRERFGESYTSVDQLSQDQARDLITYLQPRTTR